MIYSQISLSVLLWNFDRDAIVTVFYMLFIHFIQSEDGYGVHMSMYIHELNDEDFGYYKCVGINMLGREEKFIELTGVYLLFARTYKDSLYLIAGY